MGQGHYTAIVFGTTETWAVERAIDKRDGNPAGGGPEFFYESHVPWCGYIVAANNGMADGQAELKYTAVPLEDLVAHLVHQHAEAYARAVSRWEAYRDAHPDLGLPEGKLLLVADYD